MPDALNPAGAAADAPLEGLRQSPFNLDPFIFCACVSADVLRALQPRGHMLRPVTARLQTSALHDAAR